MKKHVEISLVSVTCSISLNVTKLLENYYYLLYQIHHLKCTSFPLCPMMTSINLSNSAFQNETLKNSGYEYRVNSNTDFLGSSTKCMS